MLTLSRKHFQKASRLMFAQISGHLGPARLIHNIRQYIRVRLFIFDKSCDMCGSCLWGMKRDGEWSQLTKVMDHFPRLFLCSVKIHLQTQILSIYKLSRHNFFCWMILGRFYVWDAISLAIYYTCYPKNYIMIYRAHFNQMKTQDISFLKGT